MTKNIFTQYWWLAHVTASISTLLDAEKVIASSATLFSSDQALFHKPLIKEDQLNLHCAKNTGKKLKGWF